MASRVRSAQSEDRPVSRRESSYPDIILVTQSDSGRGTPEGKTASVPLSAKDHQMIDDLALLFTIQEERCFSRASRDNSNAMQSRTSLTSSQLAEASFIYQHVDFQVLSRCVPNFVRSHLNKNGRYLPETFILRVNYWRRRRALGEDSTAKRAAKETAAKEAAAKESAAKENAAAKSGSGGDGVNSHSRLVSAKSSRTTQSVSSKQTSLSESRITLISG